MLTVSAAIFSNRNQYFSKYNITSFQSTQKSTNSGEAVQNTDALRRSTTSQYAIILPVGKLMAEGYIKWLLAAKA